MPNSRQTQSGVLHAKRPPSAGSGSVPNLSILKHCLALGLKIRHTMIYGNKTWEDILYRRQLEELAQRHPDHVRQEDRKILHNQLLSPASGRSLTVAISPDLAGRPSPGLTGRLSSWLPAVIRQTLSDMHPP
jgi:hypothetical protein